MRGNKTRQREKVFLTADIHYFRALKLWLLPRCPFFQTFWGKIFLKFVRGGRNIQWMRGVYNIGLKKLFLFLTYFVYSRYILFLSQNLFKLSQLVLKWPWSCRSNIQKCLEHLNLAKIIKWKFKSRTAKRITTDLAFERFFFNLSWRFSEISKGKCI